MSSAPRPTTPVYASGAALQRVHARSPASNTKATVTRLRLPSDVDPSFSFPIKLKPPSTGAVGSGAGLSLRDCIDSARVMRLVEGADAVVDALVACDVVVVQRDCISSGGQSAPPVQTEQKVPRSRFGFTWGELLALVVRVQYGVVAQESETRTLPLYGHLWAVAIRRNEGADGTVRWFPELVRRG